MTSGHKLKGPNLYTHLLSATSTIKPETWRDDSKQIN